MIEDHRDAIQKVGELDPVTEDMLIGQVKELELFQWFMRAHLENSGGDLQHGGTRTEQGAAESAAQ